MEFERTSMEKFKEIQRLIEGGQTDRQIARSLRCRRTLVADIRSGDLTAEALMRAKTDQARPVPAWALQVDWELVERDIRDGHQIKRLWEEYAKSWTSHPNFFKYTRQRFASLLEGTVTLREFKPGAHCEVDYAGDRIEWIDPKSGEIFHAHIFVGILCFSQKLFAIAHENEKKANWLDAHARMFEFYGGVPAVIVPDCLKNGVVKVHRYDPDLNPDYVELASHYSTAVVPARPRHPRDKALVENAVGFLMRYFRFIHRRRTFTSLSEINHALREALDRINSKQHTRFKTTRNERFETLERQHLRTLPTEPYCLGEWKVATLHPDCTVHVEGNFYSAPHVYRGKELRVKVSATLIEIYLNLERIAMHPRLRGKVGERVLDNTHLPANSRAYLEATPQMVLSQARFVHPDLHQVIHQLFEENALAHLRRAQGLVRRGQSLLQKESREVASPWISAACAQMQRFAKFRIQYFDTLIAAEKKKTSIPREDREIQRRPGNPMVRGHGMRAPLVQNNVPTQLRLVPSPSATGDQICP